MSEEELEIIELIREHENPEQALMTATLIAFGFLKQLESSRKPSVADLQVFP